MKMETIYEVVSIKQIIKEVEVDKTFFTRSPDDSAQVATHFIGHDDREVFLVMCLNAKLKVTAVHRCHVGALNASIVSPREVFKSSILNNSASIIVAHQHPSQDCTPSREDKEVTRRLVECGKILGIEVLDHLIVNSKGEYYSLKDRGDM